MTLRPTQIGLESEMTQYNFRLEFFDYDKELHFEKDTYGALIYYSQKKVL